MRAKDREEKRQSGSYINSPRFQKKCDHPHYFTITPLLYLIFNKIMYNLRKAYKMVSSIKSDGMDYTGR